MPATHEKGNVGKKMNLDYDTFDSPVGTILLRIGNECFAATLPCMTGGGNRQVCRPAR